MDSEKVRCSRDGDAFHYRWAARRCLKLIELNSTLDEIYIEGSKEPNRGGECSIDVSEYHEDGRADFYQLKHTTKRAEKNFTFSEMKDTITAFAQRFKEHNSKEKKGTPLNTGFYFVTNRPVSKEVKEGLTKIAGGEECSFENKIRKATGLPKADLQKFCKIFTIEDAEGDFLTQKYRLRQETEGFLAGSSEINEIEGLIALVNGRALSQDEGTHAQGCITREHVLERIGMAPPHRLYPAPPEIENLENAIWREQYGTILQGVLDYDGPTIVHAGGGSGKSIFAGQLIHHLPRNSWGMVYDCFGNGTYRSQSQPRHRACDAIPQIVNEMAASGLCSKPLFVRSQDSDDALFRVLLERLKEAVATVRMNSPEAVVLIAIDAADNAEMAAADFGPSQSCFARHLLREVLPEGCKLVMLCRPERTHLLNPSSTVQKLDLEEFNEIESGVHLRTYFPTATNDDVSEIHRLSSGNPRVQAVALDVNGLSLAEILEGFGPAGLSVDDQISKQLEGALSRLRDSYPKTGAKEIDRICEGLATLPPFIPIDILAMAAGVPLSAVKSLASDLVRPLWVTDDSIQFKDEPTEHWFRTRFATDPKRKFAYCKVLEGLASQSVYAARSLPALLYQAGKYQKLVTLALSDDGLPKGNPAEARDIRVFRLEFAFRAAIQSDDLAQACRLALRAGEEIAGTKRQEELMKASSILLAKTQSPHKLQELAYQSVFHAGWQGSSNIYSASLLSNHEQFRGEARSYLRGAQRWLNIFFQKQKELKDDDNTLPRRSVEPPEIAEMAWAYLNLFGHKEAVRFICSWTPKTIIFQLSSIFVRRLVDLDDFQTINTLAKIGSKEPYFILAVCNELKKVARFPPQISLKRTLTFLVKHKENIELSERYGLQKRTDASIISFCEAAAANGLESSKIVSILNRHTAAKADERITRDFDSGREEFFRGAALRSVLQNKFDLQPEEIIEKEKGDKDLRPYDNDSKQKDLKKIVSNLLPWFLLRARLIAGDNDAEDEDLTKLPAPRGDSLYGYRSEADIIHYDVARVYFGVLSLRKKLNPSTVDHFKAVVLKEVSKHMRLNDLTDALRVAFRNDHLENLRESMEQACVKYSECIEDSTPEDIGSQLIDIAKAVLPQSKADALAYFDQAVESVSKFGDEILDRWHAIQSLASRSADAPNVEVSLGHRFFRCAEMVALTVQREKHWDRCGAFQVGIRLNPIAALSAWSRWQDRGIDSYRPTLLAMGTEAARRGIFSPSSCWALTGFKECNQSGEYHAQCITKEKDAEKKSTMATTAKRDLELAGASLEEFEQLATVTEDFGSVEELKKYLQKRADHLQGNFTASSSEEKSDSNGVRKEIRSRNILDPLEIQRLVEDSKKWKEVHYGGQIWLLLIESVPRGKETEFLTVLSRLESLGYYELSDFICELRSRWGAKAGVRRMWPDFIEGIGKRFSSSFAGAANSEYMAQKFRFTDDELVNLRKGVAKGLSEYGSAHDASTLFGFVSHVSTTLSPADAIEVLSYGLGRFEKHIPDDFGDGLNLGNGDAHSSLSGLIWSSLGSPYSRVRWQAVHTVKRLSDVGCEEEIGQLMSRMRDGSVGIYGCSKYHFYELHARLYLLIALARIALENPHILLSHLSSICEVALQSPPHALIQFYAASICLEVEKSESGCLDASTINDLRNIGTSPFEPREAKLSDGFQDLPGFSENEVRTETHLTFENDFGWYWFTELRDLFGIKQTQIEEMAEIFVEEEIGISLKKPARWAADERSASYPQYGSGRETTYHSHGSYPSVDHLHFYYSYHGFMHAAAKLLKTVPVLNDPGRWYEGGYPNFLRRHLLTRTDGYWLADRRDQSPLLRRSWISENDSGNWQCEVFEDDFIDVLADQCPFNGSIFVSGLWTDCNDSRYETIKIRSALVNPETSDALATSLRSYASTWDFGLPQYDESDEETSESPFDLVGWMDWGESSDPRLDGFDPYSKRMSYPPLRIGKKFETLLNLSADRESRFWRKSASGDPSLISEIWAEDDGETSKTYRDGRRMSAKTEVLKELCKRTGLEILFSVEISRNYESSSYQYSNKEKQYYQDSHKIFLFSHDGNLRDARRNHKIG